MAAIHTQTEAGSRINSQLQIEAWINDLRLSGRIIIVEGKKDKAALSHFGVSNIITVNPGPIYKVVEGVAEMGGCAIILTDFDKKGKELYGKLKKGLVKLGVAVDNRFREELHRTKLSHIEGLVRFTDRQSLQKKYNKDNQ